MSVYLHDIPLEQALQIFKQAIEDIGMKGVLAKENIPLDLSACNRILAETVWAKNSSPHYHASAMDGFAVLADETSGATLASPKILAYGEQSLYVDTGDVLPDQFNAVIPIENVESLDKDENISAEVRSPNSIRIRSAVAPWQHVRVLGEDMVATQLVIAAGQKLRPIDLGAIAASGTSEIEVSVPPKVAIIPTGTELVKVGNDVGAGDIIEFNSLILGGMVETWGAVATRFEIVEDNFEKIKSTMLKAAKTNDLVLVNAGSSAGSEDFTAKIIEEIGELLVHGVAVRPGHPVVLGIIHLPDRKVPVVGVPGYPVSAALTGEIFVKPIITSWLGKIPYEEEYISANLTNKISSPAGDDDFMRVMLGKIDEKWLAFPLKRGAGVISSLIKADGLAILPRGVQGKMAGDAVNVQLLKSRNELTDTIFAVGSHDLTLDIITELLAKQGIRFLSSNVGSVGGLLALKRREAHLAGSHLLDIDTGEYNLSYIEKYLSDQIIAKISYVKRDQGLMVLPGNPKGIESLQDLIRSDVSFTNRQRGAGTRILLDYHIEKLGIDDENIVGYDQQEVSHLAVAASVKSKRADCGLGIAAAADALGLEFIPLYQETYDLILPAEFLETELGEKLLDCIKSAEFLANIQKYSGYDVARIGEVTIISA